MTVARALVVWLLLISLEVVHGILRGLVLVPRVGEQRADQIGLGVGSLLILAVAWACARWLGVRRRGALLAVGGLWVVLTLAFELLFGRLVLGLSWSELAADYDPRRGGLMILGMLVVLLAPWVGARLRGVRDEP